MYLSVQIQITIYETLQIFKVKWVFGTSKRMLPKIPGFSSSTTLPPATSTASSTPQSDVTVGELGKGVGFELCTNHTLLS